MTHTRIRKFNTKETYPEQNLDNDLCQAVVTHGGKTVYLRGQCPQNLDDAVNIDSHDPVEQTHKVMQNIKQLDRRVRRLDGASGEGGRLISPMCVTAKPSTAPWASTSKGVHPVSTGLVVQALARPDWLVEIDGTAVIPD